MNGTPMAAPAPGSGPRSTVVVTAAILFAVVAVAGLFYVKWDPYLHKAFVAAAKHTLGASIISGKAAAPPAASWAAAWHFAVVYGKAIWKAFILGVLLGGGVQALLPRTWLLRVLGRDNLGTTVLGGVLSVPGMM